MYATNGKRNNEFEIVDLFEIERSGEDVRYEENSRDIGNRTLLWHGSRVTNIASILAEGLKTVPPEENAIGTTFGKGIYFADVFSKSAYFCYSRDSNDLGIILLCEVALGNSHLCYDPENIENLPDNMNSVCGVGKHTFSNQIFFDDAIMPCGDLIKNENTNSCLDLNEYVIYNDAQVKIKYLLLVKLDKLEKLN